MDCKSFNIRPYKKADFDTLCDWWKIHVGQTPAANMVLEDGTFILELGNIPVLTVTVLLTQSTDMAYLEFFLKNPEVKENTEEYGQILFDHCLDYAKKKGYSRLLCFCTEEKLLKKYERFGLTRTSNNVTSFIKIL